MVFIDRCRDSVQGYGAHICIPSTISIHGLCLIYYIICTFFSQRYFPSSTWYDVKGHDIKRRLVFSLCIIWNAFKLFHCLRRLSTRCYCGRVGSSLVGRTEVVDSERKKSDVLDSLKIYFVGSGRARYARRARLCSGSRAVFRIRVGVNSLRRGENFTNSCIYEILWRTRSLASPGPRNWKKIKQDYLRVYLESPCLNKGS